MWHMKFKPHSRFALPFCIFPMLIVGVYRNFPKQNTLDFYIFPENLCWETFGRGTPSMIKSASIVRDISKKSHIPHDCEHIIPISRKFYTKCLLLPIKYGLPEASIHELYDTLIWSKIHHFFTNRHIYQFCTQNRFTFVQCIRLIYWVLQVLQLYTFQRGETEIRSPSFYFAACLEMLWFDLWVSI